MTEKVWIDLIDHAVPIITALISFVGAVGTAFSIIRSGKNGKNIKDVKNGLIVANVGIAGNHDKQMDLQEQMKSLLENERINNAKVLADALAKQKTEHEADLIALKAELTLTKKKLKESDTAVINREQKDGK